ncbi:MAG: hypothetical protein EBX90_03170, partial [Betaproteobacteria bacterium]|nr:hypothetical protein [Betaproteobacteria bacterium]
AGLLGRLLQTQARLSARAARNPSAVEGLVWRWESWVCHAYFCIRMGQLWPVLSFGPRCTAI